MADELQFPVRQRGELREEYLDNYRAGLREMLLGDGSPAFSDDQIAIATAEHGEAWVKAEGLDAVLFLAQQRALWLAAQSRPDRAASITLRSEYVRLWDLPYLAAAGGSGTISAPGAPSTTWIGSTTLGDPAAVKARDSAGRVYQVLFTEQSNVGGDPAVLTLAGITTGDGTNLAPGEKLTWIVEVPLGAIGQGEVLAEFTGGIEEETDAQYVPRLIRRIRHKPGAGNRAQIREWCERGGKNAVHAAYVYGDAFHAGSVLIALTQKRGTTTGPLARIPSTGTLTAVRNFLATTIPAFVRWVLVPPQAARSDVVLELSMGTATPAGWVDDIPWPTNDGADAASIISVSSQTLIIIDSDSAPPDDVIPRVMVWSSDGGVFEELIVTLVETLGGSNYRLTLAGPASVTLAAGLYISPMSEQHPVIAEAIISYFDSLGPGEVIDLDLAAGNDRAGFAFRWPKPSEEDPQRVGAAVIPYLQDALGPALADADLVNALPSEPTLPSDVIDGPKLLVPGHIGVYPL